MAQVGLLLMNFVTSCSNMNNEYCFFETEMTPPTRTRRSPPLFSTVTQPCRMGTDSLTRVGRRVAMQARVMETVFDTTSVKEAVVTTTTVADQDNNLHHTIYRGNFQVLHLVI